MAEIGIHARGFPSLPKDHASVPVWNSVYKDESELALHREHLMTALYRDLPRVRDAR